MSPIKLDGWRPRVCGRPFTVALATVLALAGVALLGDGPTASAAACSSSAGASSCAITGSLTVTAGTLSLESSPNLYWDFDSTGYDQWASASGASLTGCAVSGTVTHCSSGAAPVLEVLDATGSGAGWAVREYLSANTLPTGYALRFDGRAVRRTATRRPRRSPRARLPARRPGTSATTRAAARSRPRRRAARTPRSVSPPARRTR